MSSISNTQINDRNIHELVRDYITNKSRLPPDLQNIPIGDWNVEKVTDMSRLFQVDRSFNQPIEKWNVSNVTDMEFMFDGCNHFNQPLNSWNVGNVTNMGKMFYDCTKFNQPLHSWNVSKVTTMESMFAGCTEFNQPLNDWNISNDMENTSFMFENCEMFNQPLDKWNMSNVNNLIFMFLGCKRFNETVGTWDLTSATHLGGMFSGCELFNQPLNAWNVSNVSEMGGTFEDCTNFNQPLDRWNVSNVSDMSTMFKNCTSFNQPLQNWNVANLQETYEMFENCPIEEQYKPILGGPGHVPRVNPYQIHQESAKIDDLKLSKFLMEKTNLSTEIPENIQYANYINETISKIIKETSPDERATQSLQTGLSRIMNERLNNINYSHFSELQLKSVFYTLQYVIIQPPEFQKIYVETFVKECVHAYEGTNGMTCSAGALERIVYSLINACQTMMTVNENPDYERLVAILIANPAKLIPEYIMDWYKFHKIGTENAFPPNTSEEIKKGSLRSYLLEKLPGEDEIIDAKITEIADNIGYDDDDFMYGGRKRKHKKGGKRTKKTRETIYTIRKNRNVRNKKTKRVVISRKNKSKNSRNTKSTKRKTQKHRSVM
jgi:surface protein